MGGTASVIGGGKFANGATTGAFSRLFNDLSCSHQRQRCFGVEPTRDELDAHLLDGTGWPVDVIGSRVNLDYFGSAEFNKLRYDKYDVLSVDWAAQIFRYGFATLKTDATLDVVKYGNISARLIAPNLVHLKDNYSIEHRPGASSLRNIFTESRRNALGGEGTPFDIHFIGPTPIPAR